MSCPFKIRDGLPDLTQRIAALPVDERGYPVPFFVSWVDGKPDFRIADSAKLRACVLKNLCWVCGQVLGAHKTFVIGPMCSINRTSAEPPSHLDCSLWSVKGCPFLTRPKMERREDETTESFGAGAGIMIKRNPGATAVWTTKNFHRFSDGNGGILFHIGEPEHVSWFREGRPATRAEVMESFESGIPLLSEHCQDDRDRRELEKMTKAALEFLPK